VPEPTKLPRGLLRDFCGVENPSDQDNEVTKFRAQKGIWERRVGTEINKKVCNKRTVEFSMDWLQ
jgi:hypothetical protein